MYNVNDPMRTLSRAPKYVHVKEDIRRKILSKEWVDGCRIPVEAEFCEMYGVSRITVRKALEELQAEGYLEKIQGKGTYVCNPMVEQRLSKFYSFNEELRQRGMKEQAEVIELSTINADEEMSRHLQIDPGAPVLRVFRIRSTEHGPYAVENSYIPRNLVGDITKEMINENGLYKTLESFGVLVNAAQETFKAINVNKEQSKLLNVRIDAAAIALTRTAYSGSTVVEYCISIVRGDFFRFSVELR